MKTTLRYIQSFPAKKPVSRKFTLGQGSHRAGTLGLAYSTNNKNYYPLKRCHLSFGAGNTLLYNLYRVPRQRSSVPLESQYIPLPGLDPNIRGPFGSPYKKD